MTPLCSRDIDEAQIRTRLQRRAELCAIGYQARAVDGALPLAEDLAELAGVPLTIAAAALRIASMSRRIKPKEMSLQAWAAMQALEYKREKGRGQYPSAAHLARMLGISKRTAARGIHNAKTESE